jgi:hypothetical protein
MEASLATVQRLETILKQPVATGSKDRYLAVERFFRQLPPMEAARLHCQLSSPRHPLRKLMEHQLKRSSVPKLLQVLRGASFGYSCRTAPENLDDQSLDDAFLGSHNRHIDRRQEPATTFEQVAEEARAQELYEEKAWRGTAWTEASEQHLWEWNQEVMLREATRTGDYSGVEVARVMRRLRGGTGISGLRTAVGYYRVLKRDSTGELLEADGPSAGRLGPLHRVHEDPSRRHLIMQGNFYVVQPGTRQVTPYGVVQFWWKAATDADFDGLLYYADTAEYANVAQPGELTFAQQSVIAHATGVLAGVYGEGLEFSSMFYAALEAEGLSSPAPVRTSAGRRAGPSEPTPDIPEARVVRRKRQKPPGKRGPNGGPSYPLPKGRLDDAIDQQDLADSYWAQLGRSSEKTVSHSDGLGPIVSGPGYTRSPGDFPQRRAPGGATESEYYVRRYEELSGKKPPRGRDYQVAGDEFASHAEVKNRIHQFDDGTNKPTGVSQDMCGNCRLFHQKVAKQQGRQILVSDPHYVRAFNPDGTVDIYTADKEFVRTIPADQPPSAGPRPGTYEGVDW